MSNWLDLSFQNPFIEHADVAGRCRRIHSYPLILDKTEIHRDLRQKRGKKHATHKK